MFRHATSGYHSSKWAENINNFKFFLDLSEQNTFNQISKLNTLAVYEQTINSNITGFTEFIQNFINIFKLKIIYINNVKCSFRFETAYN